MGLRYHSDTISCVGGDNECRLSTDTDKQRRRWDFRYVFKDIRFTFIHVCVGSSSEPATSTVADTTTSSATSPSNPATTTSIPRLSTSDKIALGVGLGIGIPSTVGVILGAYFGYLLVKKEKLKRANSNKNGTVLQTLSSGSGTNRHSNTGTGHAVGNS